MNIQEINSSYTYKHPIGIDQAYSPNTSCQPQRREEIYRLARSIAAARFAGAHAAQAAQVAKFKQAKIVDTVEISEEATESFLGRYDRCNLNRCDQIIAALQESLDTAAEESTRRGKAYSHREPYSHPERLSA